ncbi:MAG: glycosyltransferase family 2 protein, partial [Acetobacteraceae bacterium]|nr:glycosyltransferase family 2 protein [Acetobacteraceae bacterium]
MAAHLADPSVAVVGAKLLYPNRTVQHAGVVMGLGGLCDHAYRHAPRRAPGYAWRAGLAQEVSAVTGACLLTRRSIYDRLGGLDERYASAFNDVDFCLRVREAGYRVVFAPAAELIHHEGFTYGSHYSGARAAEERADVARLRARWSAVMAADPFHSPNLDLTAAGREWSLAFPPRRPDGVGWLQDSGNAEGARFGRTARQRGRLDTRITGEPAL